jgi:hypothetical protein
VTWTRFMDMHSGGFCKLDWEYIFIELPEAEAKAYFEKRFGRDPEYTTCSCCGSDYSIDEEPTLEQASAYERGCAFDGNQWVESPDRQKWAKPYRTVEEYARDPKVLIIRAVEATP